MVRLGNRTLCVTWERNTRISGLVECPQVKMLLSAWYERERPKIDFHELMESTSLYLSSTFWSKEDEIRVRLYSSSPDFPRNHAKDLLARPGLDIVDKNELEDRHKRFGMPQTRSFVLL